ncbi:MAG: hypothetical protein COV44_09305 [Deltaproteobacteria bacterium CG11_big_fil_rev_8_21_14_0_20_45_16]|nr:MAG: hypothetical protein COV44_09305 [Deltaproteobacteria bacterium CG11_big_fil_rev_8_21_14_0_20_45_16]
MRSLLVIFVVAVFAMACSKLRAEDIWGDLQPVQDRLVEASPVLVLDGPEEDEIVFIQADGKDGKDAAPAILAGSVAESGTSASSGGHITILLRRLPKKIFISARGGHGGHGARAANGRRGRNGQGGSNASFFKKAKPGEDGEDGGEAGDGSHGGHGGNGGSVRIIYIPENPENYDADWTRRIDADVSAGRGGEEGAGGRGGRAGLGGQGGKKFWSSKRVENGSDGQDGKDGEPGRPGMDGTDGKIEFIEADNINEWLLTEQANAQDEIGRR